jgi:acyl carrier protein
MAYEREFKVNISNADADRFTRVQDVIVYLRRHQR